MRYTLFLVLGIIWSGITIAQDPPKRTPRRMDDSSLFSDDNTLTRSDYLTRFEKIFQTLNKAPLVTGSFVLADDIQEHLIESDSALNILKNKFTSTDRALNIRNLQMYNTLLDELDRNMKGYATTLENYDKKLDDLKKEIRDLRKDTVMRNVFRDTALRASFIPQLQQLRTKWKRADSLIKRSTAQINDLKAHTSSNTISTEELLYQADASLSAVGNKALGKERRYLWEPPSARTNMSRAGFKRSVNDEQKLAEYYFVHTRSKRFWLLLTGLAFFFWVFYNFRSLKKLKKMSAIDSFQFSYISPVPVTATLLLILNFAPLFDVHAPAIYIETTQFLLMLLLTFVFYKRLPKDLFWGWCFFLILFLLLPGIRILGLPLRLMRWATFIIDIVSILLGLYFLSRSKEIKSKYKLISYAVGLYIFLNFLAVICNLFGRVTLSQIFGSTAVYSLAQVASLSVLVQTITEAFLLQIQSSRIRKHYPEQFEVKDITKSIYRLVTVLAALLWYIVFTTNLNAYDALNDLLNGLFTTPVAIGSFSFTLGGIAIFLGIIWVANFLQRYIAYFFGDTGDDAAFDDKGQRSRLLITRLVLLVLGFLLAVAASGLPMDRITVIIGALGVGIGLGLQSIVNNFVSGIILIFDRPLRIGDTVEIGGQKGRIKEIGIRTSTLLTEEGAEVIMPNGDVLSHNITNWTLSNNHARVALNFSIEKAPAAEQLKQEILEIVKSNEKVVERREIEVILSNVSSKKTEIKVYFWCKDISKVSGISEEVHNSIYFHLEKKGIIIL
ncbi:Mechanosensitive ion channel [Chitinophaga sp. CF118]|uniref:mechanosensitive ion channel domain-containing protein n=1 Tax=Chitinophaga sp. CF118 TaxID=1884367 RepID=UPI0008F17C82|nr:mechanosensitive ion channel domain-containing protein [Chitinophaga sp. CF118]SFE97478.1 Mechanosensitive ion channel [Chitinophaga sp. CF118]